LATSNIGYSYFNAAFASDVQIYAVFGDGYRRGGVNPTSGLRRRN
jgi:hypothetical protein